MTREGRERALRPNDALAAVLAGLVVLALTTVAAQRNHEVDERRRAERAEAVAGTVATRLGVDLERGLRGVAAAAAKVPSLGLGATGGAAASIAPGASSVGLVLTEGDLPPVAGPPPLTPEQRSDPAVAAVLDRARDSGDPQLSPPLATAAGTRTATVAAVYRAADTPGPPLTSADRRDRHLGWVVALVDVGALVAEQAPDDVDVSVPQPGPASEAPLEDGASRHLVVAGDRTFAVVAHDPSGGGIRSATLLIVGVGVVVAAGAATGVILTRRRLRQSVAAADERGAQVRLIGEVAPLVQQSLELSEVLPSVAVQLSDHFGLAGVALSTGSSRAGQTELFSLGVAPDPTVKATLQPPSRLAAGDTLNLALQRGGRSVALLQVVAGRPLEDAELESLRALSELVTAAMVNASLYASQQETLARMRELDGLKTVFLGTASHELRTPATAIAGFAGLLTSSWDRFTDEQRRDFVGRIGANARSLSTVVQDLLDFSLLDRGTLSVSLVPLDVGAVVGGVLDRLGPAFSEHTLEAHIEPAPAIEGDQNGLERITTNLLTNAVKFSPAGTTIRVGVREDGGDALLEVCDQGPGVPADERERVFARFYRGTGDAVLQTRGVGIGLSVVSEFVARMRGEVRVDDAPGGGARFTVRLPAAPSPTAVEVADATTP